MTPEGVTEEQVEEIHGELDLDEDGISEEEITRRKTRIFVGGLRFGSEDHVLHDHFIKFGPIKEAVVIRDRKTGYSKGYGFVTMSDDMNALKAISDKSPKLDGRRCNVNLAYIGQKKKPPSKKLDLKLAKDMSPQSPSHYYPSNCYMLSSTVVTPTGQYHQLGLPPLHGCQPVYHFASSPATVYDNSHRDTFTHSPMTPVSPMYPQTFFFSQPMIFSQPPMNSSGNNGYMYPTATISEADKSNISDGNNNVAVPTSSNTFTTISPPDIVPITSHTVTNGDIRPIIVAGKSPINGNAILMNGHPDHVVTTYQPINNNIPTINGTSHVNNNTHIVQNNNHVINGTGHLLNNGNHHGHNSVTTFVTSPLASPTIHHTAQNQQVYQFQQQQQPQHFITHRDMIHQM